MNEGGEVKGCGERGGGGGHLERVNPAMHT